MGEAECVANHHKIAQAGDGRKRQIAQSLGNQFGLCANAHRSYASMVLL